MWVHFEIEGKVLLGLSYQHKRESELIETTSFNLFPSKSQAIRCNHFTKNINIFNVFLLLPARVVDLKFQENSCIERVSESCLVVSSSLCS